MRISIKNGQVSVTYDDGRFFTGEDRIRCYTHDELLKEFSDGDYVGCEFNLLDPPVITALWHSKGLPADTIEKFKDDGTGLTVDLQNGPGLTIDLKTGYRVLVKGTSTLAGIIDPVMRHYAWQEDIDPEYTYSHSGTIVIMNGRPRIVESVANGLNPNLFFQHYSPYLDELAIIAPRIPYTAQEIDAITEYATDLIAVNNFYQWWSFFCWLAYVYVAFKWKGKWRRLNLFGKGNKFSNVCYEASYLIPKHVRPQDYPKNPEQATCYDLYNPQREYIVFRHKA